MAGEPGKTTANAAAIRKYKIVEFLQKERQKGNTAETKDILEKSGLSTNERSKLNHDLGALTALGAIEKVAHGVYRGVGPLGESLFRSKEYGTRQATKQLEKQLIAHACVTHERTPGNFLLGGKFCCICHGTSTEHLFREFRTCAPGQSPQGVVTNSLPGLLELLGFEGTSLNIIGGRVDLLRGAFNPLRDLDTNEGELPSWLGDWKFQVLVLSCSSLDHEGRIWCGDDMEDFRKALVNNANERGADIVVLADRSKLGPPAFKEIKTQLKWDEPRVWLFLDVPEDKTQRELVENEIKPFREVLKKRLVTVPIPTGVDAAQSAE